MKDLQSMYDQHLKEEPEKFEKYYLKKFKVEMETSEHIKWRLIKENMEGVLKIPKEKRQEIFDRIKRGGITVGQVAKLFNLDSMVVANLFYYNISSVNLINEKTV